MKRTLLVGWDAACWGYVDPLLETNELPALCELVDSGARGTLRSTMPAHTPAAWASIATGKNPGKHGVFDFVWRPPGSYDFVPTSARVRTGTPFWTRLNQGGHRVGIVDVPFLHPPDPIEGFALPGFGAPSAPGAAHPADLLPWIEERFGSYEPALAPSVLRTAAPAELLEADSAHQRRKIDIASALAERHEVEILAINLMLTDHANHKMPEREQVDEAYRRTDADLRRLLDAFRPDNVMLISDHGSRRVKGEFLLHRWLRHQGYLSQVERGEDGRDQALNWILMEWSRARRHASGTSERLLRRALRALLPRMGPAADSLWRRIEATVPLARDHVRFDTRIDHTSSRVFLGSVYAGLLYFNLEGREPTGTVSRDVAAALAAELRTRLEAIPDPDTGRPLLSRVYTAEELYSGPVLARAPDLVLDGYDADWNVASTLGQGATAEQRVRNDYFATGRGDFGVHARDGLFVFCGSDFRKGSADGGTVADVPATLLHTFGVPIPEDYDGRVLLHTLSPALAEGTPVRRQAGDPEVPAADEGYSAEESEEIAGRLRALGYIE